jgi:transcriptional regulator with GAF, ATPase, and Fis domain
MTLSANSHGPVIPLLQERLAQTPSLFPCLERLALLAEHDVPILLTGETGTGKTSLARLLHDCSPRINELFVTVPCGALSPLLVESEFFGHRRRRSQAPIGTRRACSPPPLAERYCSMRSTH